MNEPAYPRDAIHRGYPASPESGAAPSGEVGIIEAIDLERLWLRAKEMQYVLAGIVAAAMTLAILITVLQTPQFRATARIEISRVDSGGTEIEGIALEGEARDRQYYETQYVLLRSRFLAERVAEAGNLSQDRGVLEALGFASDANPSEGQVAGRLRSAVEIVPLELSNLVDIRVSTSSPKASAQLANLWAEQFLQANYDKRFGDTVDARRQLERQLRELRERLERSEAELIGYASDNGIVVLQQGNPEEEGSGRQTLVESQLAALNDALAQATARRISAESAVRAGAARNEKPTDLDGRIAEVEATLARLRTTLGPENSQVRAAEAELRSLRSAVAQQTSRSGAAEQARLRAAQQEEAELQRRFDAAQNRYLTQQGQDVQYGILQREVSTNRELYNALLQRFKELGVSAGGRNNMTIVEAAEPPGGPYAPSLSYNLLIALGSAIALGGLLVVIRDYMDDTLRDPSEIRRRFDLPVLGLIPKFEADQIEDHLHDPHSELSEAYASARVAIDFATGPQDKMILVTSTRPDEGKSLSSLALAYTVARLGKKVLLIDMDLRRKGLSIRLNETKPSEGMATYLAGQTEGLPTVRLDAFGLDFIRAGKSQLNPADMLATSRADIALAELKQFYDCIIIDAPPVLGLADTPQLANSVDAIVYVVQANASTFRSVKQALTRLRATNGKILGALVTKLDKRNESYSYGYGYGYGYTHESKTDPEK
tara:strand:+ start:877 stop:3027 length:2151 start_codon:yes stop_codon:yes gene_type:complete